MTAKQSKDFLRGNFTPKKRVVKHEPKEDLTSQFEREALKRLGGSIAFVSKKKFLYGLTQETPPSDACH